MLSPAAKSIYQQYKADTNLVAEWLAVTAKAHGHVSLAASCAAKAPAATGGRLKGKARKQAKAAASRASQSTSTNFDVVQDNPGDHRPTPRATYLIRIEEFEPLAAFISKIENIKVPGCVSTALERVIFARKNFAEMLSSGGVAVDAMSNSRHSFFVEILEAPLMEAEHLKGNEPIYKTDVKPAEVAKNIFGVLEVDEIKSLWTDYTAGRLDLAAVSVATNLAFELARSMEEEIGPLLGTLGGSALVANRYLVALCEAFGIPKERKQQPGDPYNLDAYNLADACMMNSLTILASYLSSTDPSSKYLQTYNGSFGWYDEEMGSSSGTNRQKWQQDMSAILELMPDLSFLATKTDHASVVDEMTRGMSAWIIGQTKDVPFWLAWALQIYLDVLQSLGGDCDRGYRQMQQECLRIKHSMLNVPTSSTQRSRVLGATSIWDNDPTWVARKLMFDPGLLPDRIAPPFKFLRRNPIHCGLLLHNMRCTLHLSGGPYAAKPGALVGATQLYHALRQEKMLPEGLVWEDLETLWKMQGNPTFFVGDLPTNREAYFKNYCLSIGASATIFAAHKRTRSPKINSDNRRNLKFMGYISLQANHRLEYPGASYPLSPAAVETILNDGIRKQYTDSREHLRPEFSEKVEQARLEHAGLLPPGLIRKLALHIQDEIPDISFNLFTMHSEAWNLFERLREGFTRAPGLGPLPFKSDELPLMASLAFTLASGHMSLQGDARIERSDMLLHIAADIMQEFLQERRGRTVQETAAKEVRPEEVDGLKSDSFDPWGLKRLEPLLRRR
ncbi:hypothetical protein V8C44DRAFT_350489 [Trichoderma aethiopicum]